MPAPSPFDLLAEELGTVAGRIEREAKLRIEAIVSEMRRIDAERELRLSNLERAVSDRLASVKDGSIVTLDDVRPLLADMIAKLPKPEDGKSVTLDDVRPLIHEAIASIPAPKDGKDGRDGTDGKDGAAGKDVDPAEIDQIISSKLKDELAAVDPPKDGKDGRDGVDGKDGRDGADGKLPVAKEWADGVHYAGVVVAHEGSTYQAKRDTGREPPHDDWICLARAGQDGKDGRSFTVRGTFDPNVKDYRGLDVVALSGAAFVAKRDDPGVCPGDGWQLIAMQGKRGNPGEGGKKGDRGERGPVVEGMSVDGEGMLTLTNADGSTVTCDLYPLLVKLK